MGTTARLALPFMAVLLAACGSGTGDEGDQAPVTFDYFVHAGAGDDTNIGNEAAPFERITHALSVASFGDRVFVAKGYYNEANGEVFPLVVPAGVQVLGDEAAQGGVDGAPATAIIGAGSNALTDANMIGRTTVILQPQSVLAGFRISSLLDVPSLGPVTVWLRGDATLRSCKVEGPGSEFQVVGVFVNSSIAGALVHACRVQHFDIGITFQQGALQESLVRSNREGVATSMDPDLGGGAAGSTGGNVFTGNGVALRMNYALGLTVYALGNTWDHQPPNVSTIGGVAEPPPETDIWIKDGQGAVVF